MKPETAEVEVKDHVISAPAPLRCVLSEEKPSEALVTFFTVVSFSGAGAAAMEKNTRELMVRIVNAFISTIL
jgi:hypothetical protein